MRKLFLLFVAALGLSGCFASEVPIGNPQNAVIPSVMVQAIGNKLQAPLAVLNEAERTFVFTGGEPWPFRLYPSGNGYVVEVIGGRNENVPSAVFMYGYLAVKPDRFVLYLDEGQSARVIGGKATENPGFDKVVLSAVKGRVDPFQFSKDLPVFGGMWAMRPHSLDDVAEIYRVLIEAGMKPRLTVS